MKMSAFFLFWLEDECRRKRNYFHLVTWVITHTINFETFDAYPFGEQKEKNGKHS